eukprot:gene7266-9004_t
MAKVMDISFKELPMSPVELMSQWSFGGTDWLVIGLGVAVAYIVFGIAGFGTALVAGPILLMFMPLSKIIPLLKEKTGEASLAALRNDENIEKFAVYLYAFLPSVVRLALREQVFVQFMISNRDKIIDRVIGPELEGELLERGRAVAARRIGRILG